MFGNLCLYFEIILHGGQWSVAIVLLSYQRDDMSKSFVLKSTSAMEWKGCH